MLEWRTKQVLEYQNRAKRYKNKEIFEDNQMVYLHYRLKDMTGLLLDGTYHVNHIKKGSAHTPLGIADKFDTYKKALKNILLNKFAIETLNNKLQEVTLQNGSKELDYLPGTIMDCVSMCARRSIEAKYRETGKINYR